MPVAGNYAFIHEPRKEHDSDYGVNLSRRWKYSDKSKNYLKYERRKALKLEEAGSWEYWIVQ